MFKMHLTNRSVALVFVVFSMVELISSGRKGATLKKKFYFPAVTYWLKCAIRGKCNRVPQNEHGEVSHVPQNEHEEVSHADEPGKPTDVVADDWDVKHIKVKWKKPQYEGVTPITGYRIELLQEPYGTWATIASVTSELTEYEVSNLDKNSKYVYRVIAMNEITTGNPSDPAELITVSSAFDTPSKATNLQFLEYDEYHIDIAWNKPNYVGGGPITGYIVEYKHPIFSNWNRAITIYGDHQTTARITKFPFGELDFRVSAENKIGFGEPSRVKRVVIVKPYSKPSGPLDLKVIETGSDYIILNWEKPEHDNGDPISRYVIAYKSVVRAHWTTIGRIISDTTMARVSNLDHDVLYSFRVMALNRAGTGEASNVVDATVLPPTESPKSENNDGTDKGERFYSAEESFDSTPQTSFNRPSKPLNVKIYDWGRYYVKLMWTKPESEGGAPICKYYIEGKIPNDEHWKTLGVVDGHVTLYKVSEDKKFSYVFRVIAANEFGMGEPSDATEMITTKFSLVNSIQHKILPIISKPGPPRDLKLVSLKRDTVEIKWTRPKDTTFGGKIIGYIPEIMPENEYQWKYWKKIYGDVTSATIRNPRGPFYYRLRIRAINKAGVGEPSSYLSRLMAYAEGRSKPADVPKEVVKVPKVPVVDDSIGGDDNFDSVRNRVFEETEPPAEQASDSTTITRPTQIGKAVEERYARAPDDNRVLYKLGDLVLIKKKDLQSLMIRRLSRATDMWLYDAIISGYFYTLADEYRHFSYLEMSYSQIIFGEFDEEYLESYVLNQLKVEGITHYAVPIHQTNHWIVAIVRLRLKKYSIIGHVTRQQAKMMELFTRFLLKRMQQPDDRMENVPQEARMPQDGYNCGVYVCWHAKQFALYQDLNDGRFSPNQFRVEIFNKITNDKWKVRNS